MRIDATYENWKNKLLDLGKRNRLLNYRESTRSTVRITYPDYIELYDTIGQNEKSITFPHEFDWFDYESDPSESDESLVSETSQPALSEQSAIGTYSEEELSPTDYGCSGTNIRTNHRIPDLQKALRNLYNKSKVAAEEQGINILYLSFGFLSYTDADHAKSTYLAPLVLLPVKLSCESITSPFVLRPHEDEVVVNPTLSYLLDTQYALQLPGFDGTIGIDEYLNQVEELVKDRHWSVIRNVSLGLLSFLKINMYEDLVSHKASILQNPIIRALGGDPSGLIPVPEGLADYDFDKNERPQDVCQIVDADSSQQEAILLAKKGVSFILQGPPGTGKSQTITNIIAECLASGKKVLFVSEKMAALEVVHRRISLAGLNDFCLVLHSQKTSKKDVLNQLQEVLLLADKKATVSDSAYRMLSNLDRDRQQLNDYADQVYTKVSPLGKTIFEVNGILAGLDSYPDLLFKLDNIRNSTLDNYADYLRTLEQYGSTVGNMTSDVQKNPWNGCTLSSVSNSFRKSTGSKLDADLPGILGDVEKVEGIYNRLCSGHEPSLNAIPKDVESLVGIENARPIPYLWISPGVSNLNESIQEWSTRFSRVESLQNLIRDEASSLSAFDLVASADHMELTENAQLCLLQERAKTVLQSQKLFTIWPKCNYQDVSLLFVEAAEKVVTIRNQRAVLDEHYEESVYAIDYEAVLKRFKSEYTNIFKVFKSSYKEDKKAFLECRKTIGQKISDKEILDTIERLRSIASSKKWFVDNESKMRASFDGEILDERSNFDSVQALMKQYELLTALRDHCEELRSALSFIQENDASLKSQYDFLYNGFLTDWTNVAASWEWAKTFINSIQASCPSVPFIKQICSSKKYAEECASMREEISLLRESIRKRISWFTDFFESTDSFDRLPLRDLYERLVQCRDGMSLLEEWIDYKKIRERCAETGLKDVIRAIESDNIPTSSIIPVFQKRFFTLWLDSVLPEYPAVQDFRRKAQEKTIREFAQLDCSQFDIARARIKSTLVNSLPSMDHFSNGTDEISILKRELAKTRRIMPVRKLFKAIPNLLLTLKPCLMMSPLSVSLFLEADSYKFDTVIFDEASQVYTENAIGAISRGKQVIIAGDSKQLPPTNFFQAASTEGMFDDDDEEADINVYDSILDEANALPQRTLRWHYRSRHESLIAFSNAKIYRNQLITFPSNIEHGRDIGIEYRYLPDGYYDRGGKKGNVIEAKAVAEMVFEHFRTHPDRSLGVITFGEIQQYAIESTLRSMRIEDQSFEPFFDESKEEPFFVKSLENVQGDERDTIIFSIGYAKDKTGVFRHLFGPLGKSGGERRLNVAITRAKYNVKLVGSILPSDINESSVSTEGPKLLRSYIDYAMNGPSALAKEIHYSDEITFDSPFEESVFNYLEQKGYKLATQVGCSGYRIDIGVKHPTINGLFVLGVECDGASYHSARTARERDRLRQDVLEHMGWRIYRVWSTDWIKDPITEGKLLEKAINSAIADFDKDEANRTPKKPKQSTQDSFIRVDNEKKTIDQIENPYGFEKYKETNLNRVAHEHFGDHMLHHCVRALVENEFPIHYDYLCQRIAPLCGNEKATVKVRRMVDDSLIMLRGIVKTKGDFLYPCDDRPIVVRLPNNRKSQYISSDEFGVAMLQIIPKYIGPDRKTIITETARVYGFARSGNNIAEVLEEALNNLILKHMVEEVDGKLSVKKQTDSQPSNTSDYSRKSRSWFI